MRTRPVLVYDGDCAFCTASVNLARRRLRPRCEVVQWQSADLDSLRVDRKQAEYELLWITPAGVVYGGAQAVAKLLLNSGGGWTVPGALLTFPPIRWLAHGAYRIVANNREHMPGGTLACALHTVNGQREAMQMRRSARS
jgi:predicted DCC family thiol-disulfide oxidoreductase YuxK